MDRVGRDLLQRKKAEVTQGQGKTASRDLISLLVRANIESDTAHRLSDDDMLAREFHNRSSLLIGSYHHFRDSNFPPRWS
jgi:hypothetical protein